MKTFEEAIKDLSLFLFYAKYASAIVKGGEHYG